MAAAAAAAAATARPAPEAAAALGTGSGNGSGNGGAGSGTLVAVAGTYDVTTKFDLLDALPPDVKTALDLVLELGDSPGNFLLDMADKLPVIKYVIDAVNLFSGVRDKIVMAIDEYINRWSGGMVTVMHKLSHDLEMALRGLSTHNRLVVGTPDATGKVSVDDTLLDITFTWNGQPYSYAQNAHATFTATATGLQLTLPAHGYDRGLDFGGVLVDLIDNVALPQLTGVNSLGALLTSSSTAAASATGCGATSATRASATSASTSTSRRTTSPSCASTRSTRPATRSRTSCRQLTRRA